MLNGFVPVRPKKRTPFKAMCDVIFAIFLRELKTRFGEYRLGYAWAILEPACMVAILGGVRMLAAQGQDHVWGVPLLVFFAVGYMPYLLFSNILNQSSAALTANKGLFNYRQVKPIGAILGRAILEWLIFVCVTSFILLVMIWWGLDVRLDNPLMLIANLAALFGLSLGLGICLACLKVKVKEVEKLVPILTRPLFFISALFFSLKDIPSQYHSYLTWNPILHAVELTRSAFYGHYVIPDLSIGYVAIFGITFLFLGMLSYRLTWTRMIAT